MVVKAEVPRRLWLAYILGCTPGFRRSSCKKLLKRTLRRVRILRSRRDFQVRQLRSDIAQLMLRGQGNNAEMRLDKLWKENNILSAYVKIGEYCQLVKYNLYNIAWQSECPEELREPLESLCFAAACCADLPELQGVREILALKFGKQFMISTKDTRPDSRVNDVFREAFLDKGPSEQCKQTLMRAISLEHNVSLPPKTPACISQKEVPAKVSGEPEPCVAEIQKPKLVAKEEFKDNNCSKSVKVTHGNSCLDEPMKVQRQTSVPNVLGKVSVSKQEFNTKTMHSELEHANKPNNDVMKTLHSEVQDAKNQNDNTKPVHSVLQDAKPQKDKIRNRRKHSKKVHRRSKAKINNADHEEDEQYDFDNEMPACEDNMPDYRSRVTEHPSLPKAVIGGHITRHQNTIDTQQERGSNGHWIQKDRNHLDVQSTREAQCQPQIANTGEFTRSVQQYNDISGIGKPWMRGCCEVDNNITWKERKQAMRRQSQVQPASDINDDTVKPEDSFTDSTRGQLIMPPYYYDKDGKYHKSSVRMNQLEAKSELSSNVKKDAGNLNTEVAAPIETQPQTSSENNKNIKRSHSKNTAMDLLNGQGCTLPYSYECSAPPLPAEEFLASTVEECKKGPLRIRGESRRTRGKSRFRPESVDCDAKVPDMQFQVEAKLPQFEINTETQFSKPPQRPPPPVPPYRTVSLQSNPTVVPPTVPLRSSTMQPDRSSTLPQYDELVANVAALRRRVPTLK